MDEQISTVPMEQEEAPLKMPSFGRLIGDMGVISLFCASLHYPRISDFLMIYIGFYFFFSIATSPEGSRVVTLRDTLWILAILCACALLVFFAGKSFLTLDHWAARPALIVPLWLVFCVSYIWVWSSRRSKLKIRAHQTGC